MIGSVLRVRYEITQLLSESPIFRTYAAIDKLQSREVSVRVVKDPFARDEEFVRTLAEVVKRVSSVRQPGIEELYEVDSDDQAIFVVGQLTKGANLSERLRKLASFSVPATTEAGIAICDAVQALHHAAIAHGELNGLTVWMQADGGIRLQNSGLWQAWHANPQAKEAMLAASSAYTAPEVSRGMLPTPASDVYSVGILLFELLTGRQPYRADNAVAMALQHATEPIPSAKQLNPSVPQALDQVIHKALAKAPEDRYPDAAELLSDLRMLQDALRFGKTLVWPLRPEKAPAAESIPAAEPKAPTAPKAPKKVRVEKEEGSDIPAWLWGGIIFFGGILCVVVAILLWSNIAKPKSVQVPELKHLSFADATLRLKKVGLKISRAKSVPNDQLPADIVISTDPYAGVTVYSGDEVKAVVSSGSRFVEVPDLRGVTPERAKGILSSLGLILDDQIEQVPDKSVPKGLIVSQVPEQRGKYERKTKVRVKVSSGRGSGNSERDPEANTKYVYSFHIKLVDIDQPVNLKVDMTDSRGTKKLVEERHQPGDDVYRSAEGYGGQVTFRIFYDGDLVKQQVVKADDTASTDSGDNGDNSSGNTDAGQ